MRKRAILAYNSLAAGLTNNNSAYSCCLEVTQSRGLVARCVQNDNYAVVCDP